MMMRWIGVAALLVAPCGWLRADVSVNVNLNNGNVAADVDAGQPAPEAQAMPDDQQQDFALSVADHYQAPPERVWAYEDRGIMPEELPVVFFLARRSGSTPDAVVDLRSQGMTWQEVSQQLGVNPEAFYYRDAFRVDLGGPYSGIYLSFHGYAPDQWTWDNIAFEDQQIVDMVNLRFTSEYWHRPYYEVARYRSSGGGYYHIGYGYSHRYGAPYMVHHREHGWGHGFADHYHRAVASGHHHAFIRPSAERGRGQGHGNGGGNHGQYGGHDQGRHQGQHQGQGQHQNQGQHQGQGQGQRQGQHQNQGQHLGQGQGGHPGNSGHASQAKPAPQRHAAPQSNGNDDDKKKKKKH